MSREIPLTNAARLIRESIDRIESVELSSDDERVVHECFTARVDLKKSLEIVEAVESIIQERMRISEVLNDEGFFDKRKEG